MMEPLDTPKNIQPQLKFTPAHIVLIGLLFLVLTEVFLILRPYLNTIIMAVILASIFFPLHRKIQHRLNRPNMAALTSCIILVIVVVMPITLVLSALLKQGISSFNAIQAWLSAGNLEKLLQHPTFSKFLGYFQTRFPAFNMTEWKLDQNLMNISASVGKFLLDQGGSILGNVTGLIGKFFLMVFVFFFVIRDGERILTGILHLLPLSSSQETQIITKIRAVSRSAILGTLVTASAQGIAGGIAFWISGLPGLFWGSMMAFASLIPVIGTALIWVPAAAYLFLSSRIGMGIFLIVWSMLVVGSIDNFLRPLFMKGSAGMSTLLIFFSILGGINMFGLIGILYGPLIFGLAMVLLYIYELEFASFLKYQDNA